MVFSSYIFICCFLPIVIAGYFGLSHLKNDIYQKLFLFAASLFFYGYYNIKYLALILASIAVNYLAAITIQKKRSKLCFALGILFNIGLIGYFKYYDFFIENINSVFGTDIAMRNILLPLGISFFTFQQLSFLVSVYKGEEKVEKLQDYGLFVVFFPQLVAGPIVLYSEMIPQFKDGSRRYFNSENFAQGLYMLAIGLFKKAVIADTLSLFVDNGFELEKLGFCSAWTAALSYTLQIYFDFSGYSDMAIGLGRMFNIELPFNFISPYKSESITEFWRRWHITLGRALSSYIYRPLGGNRKGMARTCLNLLATFLVSGLWHGASWTFVLWGALHGILSVIERLFKKKLDRIPKFIRVTVTFLLVNGLWVLFRAENFGQAVKVYKGMLSFGSFDFSKIPELANDLLVNFPAAVDIVYVFALIAVLLFIVFRCESSAEKLGKFTLSRRNVIFASVLFFVSLLCLSRGSVFIYFNF